MARDKEVERERSQTDLNQEPAAVTTEPAAPTRFSAAGKIPEVAQTVPSKPTASELAYEQGPGVKALETLLAGQTTPPPNKIVDIIDAHRDETSALFALIETRLGSGYVAQVREAMGLRASIERREIVAGDPSDPNHGHFIASQKEEGARWRTENGRFSGTAGKNGLDATYRLDRDDALHGKVDTKGTGTLAWEHDGKNQGELYRTNSELGLRRNWDVDGGQLTTGARHRTHDGTANDELFGTYRTADGKTTTNAALGVNQGELAGTVGIERKPSDRDSYAGTLTHDASGTKLSASGSHVLDNGARLSGNGELAHGPTGTTGKLAAAYDQGAHHLDGNVTRGADQTSFHLGASEKLSAEQSVSGSLDHVHRDIGTSQTTLHLDESHRSDKLVHSFGIEAGAGERDYLAAKGSLDARLGTNLYAGAFGNFRIEDGHHTGAQLGASLTFTPHEKAALTLAGILDESGALETRLQLDVFKSKISGVGTIADHKKDALVSLFLSYSNGTHRNMLDDRYGAPNVTTGNDQRVMAGIKIKF